MGLNPHWSVTNGANRLIKFTVSQFYMDTTLAPTSLGFYEANMIGYQSLTCGKEFALVITVVAINIICQLLS